MATSACKLIITEQMSFTRWDVCSSCFNWTNPVSYSFLFLSCRQLTNLFRPKLNLSESPKTCHGPNVRNPKRATTLSGESSAATASWWTGRTTPSWAPWPRRAGSEVRTTFLISASAVRRPTPTRWDPGPRTRTRPRRACSRPTSFRSRSFCSSSNNNSSSSSSTHRHRLVSCWRRWSMSDLWRHYVRL